MAEISRYNACIYTGGYYCQETDKESQIWAMFVLVVDQTCQHTVSWNVSRCDITNASHV